MQLGILGARCSMTSIWAVLHRRCHLAGPILSTTLRLRPLVSAPRCCARYATICGVVAEQRSARSPGNLASLQGPPSDETRRHTADCVLSIMAGKPLKDRGWERELRAAMHVLPQPGVEAGAWVALTNKVRHGGRAAVRSALGDEQYAVPNVAGAQGATQITLQLLQTTQPVTVKHGSSWYQQASQQAPGPGAAACLRRPCCKKPEGDINGPVWARAAAGERCQLTSEPTARRFRRGSGLNAFLADLFEAIPAGTAAAALPQVLLTRWDLFHAHCFCTPDERGLGLLFHAKEYPRQDQREFPFNLGYCQRGSPLAFDSRAMDMRNLVYFQGHLCALDVGEGSPLHSTLIMDGLQDVRTVLESDFGAHACDVNYFAQLDGMPRETRLFICGGSSQQ